LAAIFSARLLARYGFLLAAALCSRQLPRKRVTHIEENRTMSSNSNLKRRFAITRLEERIAPCCCQSLGQSLNQSLKLTAGVAVNAGCLPPISAAAAVQTNPLHAGLGANVGSLLIAGVDP
jgi:hypothetical protein